MGANKASLHLDKGAEDNSPKESLHIDRDIDVEV